MVELISAELSAELTCKLPWFKNNRLSVMYNPASQENTHMLWNPNPHCRKQIQIKALVLQLYDSQKIVSLKNFDHWYRYQYSIVGNRQ